MAVITNTEAASAIATIVAQMLQRNLRANTVLPMLVGRDYDASDIREHGDTLVINSLGNLTVNTKVQGSPVTVQAPSTTGTSITMDHLEVTFGIDNVTKIQARPDLMTGYANKAAIALAEAVNSNIASTVYPLAGNTLVAGALVADSFYEADRLLNVGKLPQFARYAVLGPDAKKEAMSIDEFINYDFQGPPGWEALRTGNLGTLSSFQTFMSQGITETGGEVKNIFFSKESIQMISRPLDTSMNGISSAVVLNEDTGPEGTGLAMRVTIWYDNDLQSWQLTTDTLFGVNVVEPAGVVTVPTVDV